MNQLGLDFDVCRNRHKGNEESQAAYETAKSTKDRQMAMILGYIIAQGLHGATSDEVGTALGIYVQTASARCSELKASGHVFKHGTRKTSRGCTAGVLIAKQFWKEVE